MDKSVFKKTFSNIPDKNKPINGFTLIELLIVIAIIGFLTSIVLANVKEAAAKTRDAIRLANVQQIKKALENYEIDNNTLPFATCPTCAFGGWEISAQETEQFMEYLSTYFSTSKTPLDPVNKLVNLSFFGPRPGDYFFAYYKYPAKWGPCAEITKSFAVLAIRNLEILIPNNLPESGMPLPKNINLPRAECGNAGQDNICTLTEYKASQCRDWSQEFDYSIMLSE